MRVLRTVLATSLLTFAVACSGEESAPPPPPPAGGTPVDPATAGVVTGRVTFAGDVPRPHILSIGTDRACVAALGPNPQSDAVIIAAGGALKNVFVHISDALSQYTFEIPTAPVEIDQHGCVYSPRVLGVRAGQPIEVVNSDPTLHNVHALPMHNQEFNEGQPKQGMRLQKTFTVPEVMVRFKCDVHGWMAAHVGVMGHPYFAVTGADGTFDLKGIPPGTYTIEAWHERFGTRSQRVTVGPKSTQSIAFTFASDLK